MYEISIISIKYGDILNTCLNLKSIRFQNSIFYSQNYNVASNTTHFGCDEWWDKVASVLAY